MTDLNSDFTANNDEIKTNMSRANCRIFLNQKVLCSDIAITLTVFILTYFYALFASYKCALTVYVVG